MRFKFLADIICIRKKALLAKFPNNGITGGDHRANGYLKYRIFKRDLSISKPRKVYYDPQLRLVKTNIVRVV